jgi:hypothetical protein
MPTFLYVCAILCAIIGVLFSFPLVIVAIFIAALGALVSNTTPRPPTAGYQPSTGDQAPEEPPMSMGEAYRKAQEQRHERATGRMW